MITVCDESYKASFHSYTKTQNQNQQPLKSAINILLLDISLHIFAMCINIRKTLNPKAQEWRPTSSPQPVIGQPLSQALVTLPPAIVTFPQEIIFHFPHHHSHGFSIYNINSQCQPFFYASSPKAISGDENVKINYKEKMEGPGDDQTASVHVFKKGIGRVLPPRLQRFFSVPPLRKEWRPRKSSGVPPRRLPPQPTSSDDVSHSSYTTVMIKNIPNQLGRDFMLKFLDENSKTHSLEYDFLYLPMDFRKEDNLGYAFVNFTTPAAAKKFKKILHNFKWGTIYTRGRHITSKKICEITWARIQGKQALMRRFQNSNFSCDKLDFLPVILDPPRNGSEQNPPALVVLGSLVCDNM